jgi:hypothetical protein
MRSHPIFFTSNLTRTPQNENLSQWQQALQQSGNGMNPSVLHNNNLALLMGMQQQQSQPHPQVDQLALFQQQLSYYRYNMIGQSGNQMNAGTTGAEDRGVQQANTTSPEPHQTLVLPLAQAHQSVQKHGKSIIPVGTLVSFRGH